MPELPEVETIRRGLQEAITNKKIADFVDLDKKVVRIKKENVLGRRIVDILRRAKILIFVLDDDSSLIIHLKMTGQLIWESCEGEKEFCLKKRKRVVGGHPSEEMFEKLPTKHTRAIFKFVDGSVLYFNDLRRFGYIKKSDFCDFDKILEVSKLGPEPLDQNSNFSALYLINQSKRFKNRTIKQFILDQEIIAGVGNIYSDEALFYGGIVPTKKVSEVTKAEWERLFLAIKKALNLGIKYGGSSEDTFVNAFGERGKMTDYTNVYRKEGKRCPICGGEIKKIKLGGRGTHYCPRCQK